MWKYTVRRVLAIIPVAGVIAIFVFLLLHLAPGDPAAIIAGNTAMPEDIARIRVKLGLEDPIYVQFVRWMGQLLRGDLGMSIYSDMPVTTLIAQRMEGTLCLAGASITIAVFLAVPMGILAAWKVGTWVDYVVMMFAVFGFSIPVFVIGYLLIFGFSVHLHWFPVQGFVSIREGVLPFLRSITLPSLALGLIYAALIARITRASVLEILSQDYIRTAQAKGLSAWVLPC
jgi:peptide/nickel transport system permease protein